MHDRRSSRRSSHAENLKLILAGEFWEDRQLTRKFAVQQGYGCMFESGNELDISFEFQDE